MTQTAVMLRPTRPAYSPHRSVAPQWLSTTFTVWTSSVQSGCVLIVDDDRSLLSLLSLIFRSAGFEVTTAPEGSSALEAVRTCKPDAIVLDLEMPGMNGRDFFRELRSQDNTTPVLILSAYNARKAQMELGADAYTAKPFDPDQLVESVRDLLARSDGR